MSDATFIYILYGFFFVCKIYFYYQDFTDKNAYNQFKGIFTKSFSKNYTILDERFYKAVYAYSFVRDIIIIIFAIYNIFFQPTFELFTTGIGIIVTVSLILQWYVWDKCVDNKIIKRNE